MSLTPRATLLASAGALVAWLAALLGTIQIAYMRNAFLLLHQDSALVLVALAGFSGTILFILSRSRISTNGRLVLAAACVIAFPLLAFWGVLSVACANGNCL